MRPLLVVSSILLLSHALAPVVFAQNPAKLTFEVATVKPTAVDLNKPLLAGSIGMRGGPGTDTPEQITNNLTSLKQLILQAYGVLNYQVTGPAWLDTERFDIVAKVPAGATKEQVKVMWQNLLADRFVLKLHHESKEFPVDELVVARGGHKLKETTLDPNTPPPTGTAARINFETGILPTAGMVTGLMSKAGAGITGKLMARAQPISALVTNLSNQLKHPVVDKTELTGKYDFVVEFAPEGVNLPAALVNGQAGASTGANPGLNASEPGLTLAAAIQAQLGLRLVGGKAPLDMIVVDSAEKVPTEN